MKKYCTSILILSVILFGASCQNKNNEGNNNFQRPERNFQNKRMGGGFNSGVESIQIDDHVKFLKEDCVENYKEDFIVRVEFQNGKINTNNTSIAENGITIKDENDCITIENKGSKIIKYSLSGNLDRTLKIKNNNADCILELNNLNIKSTENGPALHITSENYRTFLVVNENTVNNLTDSRVLDENKTIENDKKGSVYAKGALIITGKSSTSKGGILNINNTGYKHGLYSNDYLRIQNVTLNVNCNGKTSRDCIRTLNGVIIDDGNINLISKGIITDNEGCGIKVEGEDDNSDKKTVEYTAGAGFVVINNGNLNIDVSAKGISAHWKYNETEIGNSEYTENKNNSLLYSSGILNKSAEKPEPYLIVNGGNINIKTNLQPYENNQASCSPEGMEAKYDLIINGGNITIDATDDGINAGGSIQINDGNINVASSQNDAIDANGFSGIIINGGFIEACGISTPECAFDCDNSPFVINGGTVIGFGSSNITMPSENSTQNILVLGANEYSGKTVSIKQNSKILFEKELPSRAGEIIILSIPEIKKGECEILVNGKTSETYTIESTVSKVNVSETGFGFGKGGGFGRGGDFEKRGDRPFEFDENFQNGMPEPPEGMPAPENGMMPPEGKKRLSR
ncbi:MAG: carbohydrate-binding domain-containing protein [Treponema sp.]|nr:carbohydrate-binding domain-containing protein [Treponema sp.]